jgi:hypothetical protein
MAHLQQVILKGRISNEVKGSLLPQPKNIFNFKDLGGGKINP